MTAPRRPGLLTDLGAAALALVLVGIAGMLGKWQYDAWQAHRDAEARDLTGIAPVPLDDVMGNDDPFPAPDLGRPVEVAGEAYLQESLAKPIEDLPLPARAVNALKNAEISVVADLVQKTDEDLENVKNLGSKSIEEIKVALAALGLSLGMRIDPNLLGALDRGGAR